MNCSIHPAVDKKGFARIVADPSIYTELVIRGMQNHRTNIICHLGFKCGEGFVEKLDFDRICKAAIQYRVAIEINLNKMMRLIFDELLDFKKFPPQSTEDRNYLRKKIRSEPDIYMPLIGNKRIRGKMKKYFSKGLKITINTDQHENPFIGDPTLRKGKEFRQFNDLSVDNREFRMKRMRFFRSLIVLERIFQKLFEDANVKPENIINAYSVHKLTMFLKKQI